MPLATEYQLGAIRDDGSPEGVMMTQEKRGRLVRVDLVRMQYTNTKAGTGAANLSLTEGFNQDGSGTTRQLTSGATLGYQNYAQIQITVWGRVVGIRFLQNNSVGPFGCVIDGRVYWLDTPRNRYNNQVQALNNGDAVWIVDDNLHDGPHSVMIMAAASDTLASTVNIHGFALEERVGYREHPRPVLWIAATAPTASFAAISVTSGSANVMAVDYLVYYNSTGGSLDITVEIGSTVITGPTTIAAGGSLAVPTYGVYMDSGTGNWKHKGSSTGLTCFVVARF